MALLTEAKTEAECDQQLRAARQCQQQSGVPRTVKLQAGIVGRIRSRDGAHASRDHSDGHPALHSLPNSASIASATPSLG